MKVKDEKNTNTNIVRFETSTSPSWKDIKIFILYYFFKTITQLQNYFLRQFIYSEESKCRIKPGK